MTVFGTVRINISHFIRSTLRIPFRLHVHYKRMVSPTAPTYVLIHGLADTSAIWQPVIKMLPKKANYIAIDLLGHGNSKHSSGKVYASSYQARNVLATCLGMGYIGPYIFIGHSFGSIVAVECAKRYPNTKQLILCSLPLYRKATKEQEPSAKNTESILFEIYRQSLKHPKGTIALYNLIEKIGIGGPSKTALSAETFWAFKETLRSGIMNQRTTENLRQLKIPINIIYGKLDPLIISKNLKAVAKGRPNIEIKAPISDHALRGPILKAIEEALAKDTNPSKK